MIRTILKSLNGPGRSAGDCSVRRSRTEPSPFYTRERPGRIVGDPFHRISLALSLNNITSSRPAIASPDIYVGEAPAAWRSEAGSSRSMS